MITLLRIVLSCFLSFYLLDHFHNLVIPTIVFLLILLTDFLDGKVARFYGTSSLFGAVFDILADLFFIVTSYLVLCSFKILPFWFFLLILFKFLEFALTSFFLKNQSKRKSIFVFDVLGRLAAALFYVLPLLAYVSFHSSQWLYLFIINILVYIITLLVLLSSLTRLASCWELKSKFEKDQELEPMI